LGIFDPETVSADMELVTLCICSVFSLRSQMLVFGYKPAVISAQSSRAGVDKSHMKKAGNNYTMRRARMLTVFEFYLWHGNPDAHKLSKRWNPDGKWHAACTYAAQVSLGAFHSCSAAAIKDWFDPTKNRKEPAEIARLTLAAHWDMAREQLERGGLYTGKGWNGKATPEAVFDVLRSLDIPSP
jgi:hypothetical protein